MSSPTYQQLETLADFLKDNPEIAKGLLHTAHTKQITKSKWVEISLTLNALDGAQKDEKGWAKYWADKKCYLKEVCGQHAESMRRTGGTAENLSELSPLDKKFLAVVDDLEFAAGDSFQVNPLPSTSHLVVETADIEDIAVHTPETAREQMLLSPLLPTVEKDPEPWRDSTPSRDRSPVHGPGTARNRSHPTKTRSRSLLDQERDRFIEIERQRVQAETTTGRALSEGVQMLAQLLPAVGNLSAAITEFGENILMGLNNIAGALERRQ